MILKQTSASEDHFPALNKPVFPPFLNIPTRINKQLESSTYEGKKQKQNTSVTFFSPSEVKFRNDTLISPKDAENNLPEAPAGDNSHLHARSLQTDRQQNAIPKTLQLRIHKQVNQHA